MRQRLGLAAALLRRPRLLVLDEPTTGLDPAGMRDMRALVRRLAGEGITVLLSSHLMGEVEALCNRVAILSNGRVRYEGGLADLLARSGRRYRLDATDAAAALALCQAAAGIRDARADGDGVVFTADRDAVAALTLQLAAAGVGVHALVPAGGLEELFFDLTDPEAS
jgi:ABC-2 type transport system ATP-binding protein